MATVGKIDMVVDATIAPLQKKLNAASNSLRSTFGKGSPLGQFGSMLRGAGAIAAVGIIGSQLEKAALAGKKFAEDLATGEKSFSQLREEIVFGIPVLGNYIQAFTELGSLIDGSTFAIAKFNAEQQKSAKRMKEWEQAMDAAAGALEKYGEETAQILGGVPGIGLSGFAAEQFAAIAKMQDQAQKARMGFEDASALLAEKRGVLGEDWYLAQQDENERQHRKRLAAIAQEYAATMLDLDKRRQEEGFKQVQEEQKRLEELESQAAERRMGRLAERAVTDKRALQKLLLAVAGGTLPADQVGQFRMAQSIGFGSSAAATAINASRLAGDQRSAETRQLEELNRKVEKLGDAMMKGLAAIQVA